MFHNKCLQMLKGAQDEVAYLRAQVRGLQERNDRLVEALARKEGVPLQLPIEPYAPRPAEEAPPFVPPRGREAGDSWWRSMVAGHRISSPVPEEKVAPNS